MGRHVNADAGLDEAATDLENPQGEHDARHATETEQPLDPQAETAG